MIDRKITAKTLQHLAGQAPDAMDFDSQALPEPVALASAGVDEMPPARWLIDGLLPRPGIAAMVAPPKAGKSLIVNQMQAAMLSGKPLLDMQTQADPDDVCLTIDLEMQPSEAAQRQRDLLQHLLDIDDLTQAEADSIAKRMLTASFAEVESISPEMLSHYIDRVASNLSDNGQHLALVVIDSMYVALGDGDESDQRVMRAALRQFKQTAIRHDCGVLLVHHATKGWSDGKSALDVASGSGVLGRMLDSQITLRPHAAGDGTYSVHITSRSAPASETVIERRYPIFDAVSGLTARNMLSRSNLQSQRAQAVIDEKLQSITEQLTGMTEIYGSKIKQWAGSPRRGDKIIASLIKSGHLIATGRNTAKGSPIYTVARINPNNEEREHALEN